MSFKGDELVVEGITWLYEKTAMKVGRGVKSRNCIRFYNDVQETDEEELLKSREEEDATLVVFRRKGVFYSSYIVGDTCTIFTEADNLGHSLLLYIGIYKVLNRELPKSYSQVLGILNSVILNDKWNPKDGKQSNGYFNVKETLEKEMLRGNICSGIGKQK